MTALLLHCLQPDDCGRQQRICAPCAKARNSEILRLHKSGMGVRRIAARVGLTKSGVRHVLGAIEHPNRASLEAAREAQAVIAARRALARAHVQAGLLARAKEAAARRGQAAAGGKKLAPRQLVALVAAEHLLTVEDIIGKSRTTKIVAARHAALKALAETYPKRSLSWLGQWVGSAHHTTVYYALNPHLRQKKYVRERQQSEARHAA